jgi:hypothetical protein
MASNIVQCDECGKVTKQDDAHGWFDVRVFITKPTPEQYEMYKQNPMAEVQMRLQDVRPAELPALIGGDFCTLECLSAYYNKQRDLRELLESEPVEKGQPEAEAGSFTDMVEKHTRQVAPPPPQMGEGRGHEGYI